VDRQGALVWESLGYGAGDTTWEKRMLEMLEQVVSGK